MNIIRQQLQELVCALPSRKRPQSVPSDDESFENFKLNEEMLFATAITTNQYPEWIKTLGGLSVVGTHSSSYYTTITGDIYMWFWASTTGTTYKKIVDAFIMKISLQKPTLIAGVKIGLLSSLHRTIIHITIDETIEKLLKDGTDATLEDYQALYAHRCNIGITVDIEDVLIKARGLIHVSLQTFLTPRTTEESSAMRDKRVDVLRKLIQDDKYQFFIHAPYNYNGADIKANNTLMIRELKESVKVGTKGVVIHVGHKPGKTTLPDSVFIDRMLMNFKLLLTYATKDTPLLLETPPGKENELCISPGALAAFYEHLSPDERARSGLVVDTCHVFDAGYEPMAFLEYLHARVPGAIKLIHFNDSTGPCGCRRDIHASPGGGFTILKQIVAKCEIPKLTFAGEGGYLGVKRLVAVADWAKSHNVPCIVE